MKILIIEDEPLAVQHLSRMIGICIPEGEIIGNCDSVKSSVTWLKKNNTPDLIFMDIQLADGKSFQIFDQHTITSPVIFTTAYDEYALKAFKFNSIDYILKPVDEVELKNAVLKLKTLTQVRAPDKMMEDLQHAVKMLSRKYKERFIIKVGEHLKSLETNDLLFFFSQEKITFAQGKDGRKHILENTLDELEQILDPARFFRINRKYIAAVDAIQDMISHTNSRLKLLLKTSTDQDIIVARERIQEFRSWLDR